MPSKKSSERSDDWKLRAERVIAHGGCNTFSKRPDQYAGVTASHYELLPNGMTDWVNGLGSNLRGVQNNYALESIESVVLAEMICEKFPVQMIKILKSGSSACSAAVRFARSYTGRSVGVGQGYHGSDNNFIAAEQPAHGCVSENYTKLPSLEAVRDYLLGLPVGHTVGYCFLEPVQLVWDIGKIFKEIRKLCTKLKILLIVDEVVTSMRVPGFSVCAHFGVTPDLMVLGKGLGNGYPIAVVGGKREIMSSPAFISNTFNGELSSINSAIDVLRTVSKHDIDLMWQRGIEIQSAINSTSQRIQLTGIPTRGTWTGAVEDVTLMWQEMYKRGHLLGRAWFMNLAITDPQCLQFIDDYCAVMNAMESPKPPKLIGPTPVPLFKRYS
jgi:acetylornithine/succinyldiaminopimelate/putrescine aminotransferase